MEGLLRVNNFKPHPSNPSYMVFFFKESAPANYFEMLLVENKVDYERANPEEGENMYLFAIKKSDFTLSRRLNNLTKGKYRNRFIANKTFGIAIVIITIAVLLFAFIGYISAQ